VRAHERMVRRGSADDHPSTPNLSSDPTMPIVRLVLVKGPSIVGENCKIGPNASIGPYTAVGDRCEVARAEVDDSTVMDDTVINVERKIVRSMIGKGSKILSANGLEPKGLRFVVGKHTAKYL